jgi:3',5'-cyclic AMP phosphodiesterase CpdA
MKRIAWLTDIHLNFLRTWQLDDFFATLESPDIDTLLISGDIGEATDVIHFLNRFEDLEKPAYFVLGNHDFYHGSIKNVRVKVEQKAFESKWLTYLTACESVIELSPSVGLIGHDSWADGRCGDYEKSDVTLNDYVLIQEFVREGFGKDNRLRVLNELGDAAAQFIEVMLPKALAQYEHIFIVTHVPPFREATWHAGQISGDDFLPHFSCKVVGEILVEVMRDYPQHQLTVLCGHTHGEGRAQILDNLVVLTGGAEYGLPEIKRIFELG